MNAQQQLSPASGDNNPHSSSSFINQHQQQMNINFMNQQQQPGNLGGLQQLQGQGQIGNNPISSLNMNSQSQQQQGDMNSSNNAFLSNQARERQLILLHQQQQQRLAAAGGIPVLPSMPGAHDRRYMVDDFTGAGLLSRPEQEFALLAARSGYPQSMDLSHPGKLADFLIAKQAAVFNGGGTLMPKMTRLPCQARGMKADHNSGTAFFEIPEDARHGQHLLCSHPVCRSAGVKFRYCKYCSKPVTKQNFRSRHLHADLDPNHNHKMGKLVRKRSSSDASGKDTKQRKLASLNVKRSTHWQSLLRERPIGLRNMDDWIADVIYVSDPKSKFADEGEALDSVSGDDVKTITWNTLLKERAEGSMDKAAVNKWLTRVLDASVRDGDEEEDEKPLDRDDEEDSKETQESAHEVADPSDEQLDEASVN